MAGLLEADDLNEARGGVGRDVEGAGAGRLEVGALERGLGLRVLADEVEQVAAAPADPGGERRPLDGLRGGQGRQRLAQAVVVAAGHAQREHPGVVSQELPDALAVVREGRQAGQARGVLAGLHPGEPGGGLDRPIHGARVAARELAEQGLQLHAPLVEAPQRAVEGVGVPGPAHPHVEAGFGARRFQRLRLGVEVGVGGVGGGRCVRDAGGEQAALQGGARRGVPDLVDAGALGRAGGDLLGFAVVLDAEPAGDGEAGEGHAGEGTSPPGRVGSQGREHGVGAGVAVGGGDGEAAGQDLVQPPGHASGLWWGRGGGVGRAGAEQGLPAGDGERVLIGAMIAGGAGEALGGHVGRRAAVHRGAGGRHAHGELRGLGQVGGGPGEPEVDHAGVAAGVDDDVLGLEVAVDEIDRVRGRQPAPGLDQAGEDRRGAPRLAQPLAQVLALDVLHRHEHVVVEDADLVDGDDVRVLEPGQGPALAQDLLAAALAAVTQDLEGDLAVEVGVVGDEDDAHAAAAERLEHGEASEAERLAGGAEQAASHGCPQRGGVGVGLGRPDRGQDVVQVAFASGLGRWGLVHAGSVLEVVAGRRLIPEICSARRAEQLELLAQRGPCA